MGRLINFTRVLASTAVIAAMLGPAQAQTSGGTAAPPVAEAASAPVPAPVRRPVRNRLAALHVLPPLRPTFDPVTDPAAKPDIAAEAAMVPTAVETAPGPLVATLPPSRPTFPGDAEAVVLAAVPEPPPPSLFAALFGPAPNAGSAPSLGSRLPALAGRARIDALIAEHAKLNEVPESLVHRVVVRESRYNPRAVGRGGALGLMQIKTGTARALGYEGDAAGLLDAETNLTYAVKYLAGAYRVAGGNHDLAVRHYALGYYYAAKRQGLTSGGERRVRFARRRNGGRLAEAEPPAGR